MAKLFTENGGTGKCISVKASYIVGAELVVDGGYAAR